MPSVPTRTRSARHGETEMEVLLSRPVVVGLALLGAGFSLAASHLRTRGVVAERGARRLNLLGYACMGASMALFIAAGLRGAQG